MSQIQLPLTAKCAAILQYKETLYPNEKKIESIEECNKLLLLNKYDKAIAHVNIILNDLTHGIIPCLDIRLRAHMAKLQYSAALEDAVEMQTRVPGSYFGYVRAVQIHIILDQFSLALEAFEKGFVNLERQEHIDALAKSMCILDAAAADFGLMNQFDNAHELAHIMVTLVPRSPIGYLRAGTVYLLQGKADSALDMYNRGIAKVSNNQQLIRRKDYVLRKFKNNDPITRAPFDVLGWIVQHLNSHDLFTCLNVCYDWCVRFQQYPQPWRSVVLCDHTNMDLLQQARSYIQSIHIMDTAICMVNSCLKLVSSDAFPNLVQLDIDNKEDSRHKKCISKSHSMRRQGCTKIVECLLTHYEALKLVLEQKSVPICSHFNELLGCDPQKLHSIVVSCPTLRMLLLDDSMFQSASNAQEHQSKEQKLRTFYSLTTDIADPRNNYGERWTHLPDITSKTLQKLSFSLERDDKSKQWIGICPALSDLTLKDMKGMNGSIFYAIKRLPKLHRLIIRKCEGLNRSRFEGFFHMLAYKRDQVQLHTVVLDDVNAVLPQSLHAMSRYRNLRSLTLINCKCVNGMAIGVFAGHLGEMDSLLEELVLAQIGAVTDGILVQVVNTIPRLKCLGLEQLEYITDDGIVQIANRSQHRALSTLGIYNCSLVTDRGVGYAMRYLSVKTESSIVLDEGSY